MMAKSMTSVLLVITGSPIGVCACGGPRTQTSAPAPADSLEAVTLAVATFQADVPPGERHTLVVHAFDRDSAGVVITLFPDPLVPGGGGRVRITKDHRAAVLERFE